jgi:hypothetical protein
VKVFFSRHNSVNGPSDTLPEVNYLETLAINMTSGVVLTRPRAFEASSWLKDTCVCVVCVCL